MHKLVDKLTVLSRKEALFVARSPYEIADTVEYALCLWIGEVAPHPLRCSVVSC